MTTSVFVVVGNYIVIHIHTSLSNLFSIFLTIILYQISCSLLSVSEIFLAATSNTVQPQPGGRRLSTSLQPDAA
nr:MAG TPA_asm: hypothetical protein [Caudoviricetes sp.]